MTWLDTDGGGEPAVTGRVDGNHYQRIADGIVAYQGLVSGRQLERLAWEMGLPGSGGHYAAMWIAAALAEGYIIRTGPGVPPPGHTRAKRGKTPEWSYHTCLDWWYRCTAGVSRRVGDDYTWSPAFRSELWDETLR